MNFSRSTVFHMKTRVCLKYLVRNCRNEKTEIAPSYLNKNVFVFETANSNFYFILFTWNTEFCSS